MTAVLSRDLAELLCCNSRPTLPHLGPGHGPNLLRPQQQPHCTANPNPARGWCLATSFERQNEMVVTEMTVLVKDSLLFGSFMTPLEHSYSSFKTQLGCHIH